MSEREEAAKKLWEAGHGRNEIARQTGIPRSTITRWSKGWGPKGQPERILDPMMEEEEERLRRLATPERYEVPGSVWIQNDEERAQYLFILEQAEGDHTRIAREYSGGPFKLLPPRPPPMSRKDQYYLVYGPGTREERERRLQRKRIKQQMDYQGYTHPPGFGGE